MRALFHQVRFASNSCSSFANSSSLFLRSPVRPILNDRPPHSAIKFV
jgi:hypothetical protein